jgi:hypothetical protein
MAKKKTEIKQKQKQTINITIGDKAVKRKRGRPRKAKSAKGSGIVSGGFVAPIINYPPAYTPPSIPQQPQAVNLIPKAPVGVPPAKQPRGYAVFPEGETADPLGLTATNPVELKLEKEEPNKPIKERPISAFSTFDKRLAAASQAAKFEILKQKKIKAENTLGGRDTNLGDAYEPDFFQESLARIAQSQRTGSASFLEDIEAVFGQGATLVPEAPAEASLVTQAEIFSKPVLPPIKKSSGIWTPPGVNIERTPRRRRPEGIRPPDFPPPETGRLKADGTPDKRFKRRSQRPVEPLEPPPEEEGIRFLGSSREPAEEPPSLERQRPEAVTAVEATFLSA